jgi:hypothetical protein
MEYADNLAHTRADVLSVLMVLVVMLRVRFAVVV